MAVLDKVYRDLEEAEKSKPSFFQRLIGRGPQRPPVLGAYLYGGVGCGKTFLMDLFFACVPGENKRRVHFHSFMLEVHQRLHEIRKAGGRSDTRGVAQAIMGQGVKLFCFDEFNVTDIGDAVILRDLFGGMWEHGAVLVSTSNRAPTELYKNGLQRDLFVPCIEMIKERCAVHDMNSTVDLRLLQDANMSTYIVIATIAPSPEAAAGRWTFHSRESANVRLDRMFAEFSKHKPPRSLNLISQGRTIHVPRASIGVANFEFHYLCGHARGSADYLAIARAFHTVIVRNIPRLSLDRLPEVRRFITLIDVLYDCRVKLICSAEAPPFDLFRVDSNHDESFAFHRTASRLQDMQSEAYWKQAHTPAASKDSDDMIEIVQDVGALWRHYDKDHNGVIDKAELRLLLEDIMQAKAGHRHVSDEVVELAYESMTPDKSRGISQDDFRKFSHSSGVMAWYL